MRSVLALAALATAASADYNAQVIKHFQPTDTQAQQFIRTAGMRARDRMGDPQMFDPFAEVVVGDFLYFCAELPANFGGGGGFGALFSMYLPNMDDQPTRLTILNSAGNNDGIVCKGMVYDAGRLSFIFRGGSGHWDIAQCGVSDGRLSSGCTLISSGLEGLWPAPPDGLDSTYLEINSFKIMGNGDIIVAGGPSRPLDNERYTNQLYCLKGGSLPTRIDLTLDNAAAYAKYLTRVGDSLIFIATMASAPDDDGSVTVGPAIGRLSPEGNGNACEYTLSRVQGPISPELRGQDFIFGITGSGFAVVRWWNSEATAWGLVGVNAAGQVAPIYIPNPADKPSQGWYYSVGEIFGWAGPYLLHAGLYKRGTEYKKGLIASRWQQESTQWVSRVVSDTGDEDDWVFAGEGNDVIEDGLIGNALFYDEDAQYVVLSGMWNNRKMISLDVSKLMTGTLGDGERLPKASITMPQGAYDTGSWPDTSFSNMVAGKWAFTCLSINDEYHAPACNEEQYAIYAIDTTTHNAVRILKEYDDFYPGSVVELPDLNAIAMWFIATSCASGDEIVSLRIFRADTMKPLGVVRLNPDDMTQLDIPSNYYGSNLVVSEGALFLGVEWNTYGVMAWTLPTEDTAAAWRAAFALPMDFIADTEQIVPYVYSYVQHQYKMMTAAFGRVAFTNYNTGCLQLISADGTVQTPVFPQYAEVEGGEPKCVTWAEPFYYLPFGPTGEMGLFFTASNSVIGYATRYVMYESESGFQLYNIDDFSIGESWTPPNFMSDGQNIYYFATTIEADHTAVLVKWNGVLSSKSTVILADYQFEPNADWNVWGPYPELVLDYYDPGVHAILVASDGNPDADFIGLSEPTDNILVICVTCEQAMTERLPRPADFFTSPENLRVDSSASLSIFFAIVGRQILMSSRSMSHGDELYTYAIGSNQRPVMLMNAYSKGEVETFPAGLRAIPDTADGRKQALVTMDVSGSFFTGLTAVHMGYVIPPPSPSATPSVTPSPSVSLSPSMTPSTSFSASVTPSTSFSATPTPSTSFSASASAAAAGTPSPTASASQQPVAKIEVKLTVPAVNKATLMSSGAALYLRSFLAFNGDTAMDAVRITMLTYKSKSTRAVLLTLPVEADDPINLETRRMRRMQNEPSGPDVALELIVEILHMQMRYATPAAEVVRALLADNAALLADPFFSQFVTALCGSADCSDGAVLSASSSFVTTNAPVAPAAAEKDDKVGPGVGGFFGAAAGLLLIGALYYYFYYKPAQAAKTPASLGKMVVRNVSAPADATAPKTTFTPTTAAV